MPPETRSRWAGFPGLWAVHHGFGKAGEVGQENVGVSECAGATPLSPFMAFYLPAPRPQRRSDAGKPPTPPLGRPLDLA